MDLKTRFKNKTFILAFVSALMLIAQECGLHFIPGAILDLVNSFLALFVLLGIVIDPTTPGITDKK